jgi:hypothetical protein
VKRSRTQIILVGLTVLALSAGVVAGMLASRIPAVEGHVQHPSVTPAAGAQSQLTAALGLSPDQQEKMRSIWEGVRTQVQDYYQDAEGLQKQRDDAIASLLTDEQKARFEKLSKDYASRYDELVRRREAAFEKAVESTRKILDETQRQKYDEILKSRVGHLPGSRSAATQPATQS